MTYKHKSPEDLKDVFDRSVLAYTAAVSANYPERMMCLEDRRFAKVNGAIWEGDFGAYFENKPKMAYNPIPQALKRVLTQYKANRISVKFTNSDPDLTSSDKTSEALSSILRADEQRSNARKAYDYAFISGVSGGMGAWRLRNGRKSPKSKEQVMWIDTIRDADSCVFWDVNAMEEDKSDAKCCWVLVEYDQSELSILYDVDPATQKSMSPSTWSKPIQQRMFDVNYGTMPVYLAEYYEVETTKVRQFHYESPLGEQWVDSTDTETIQLLEAQGYEKTHTETYDKKRVHRYLMSGSEILEDFGYIAGPNIPIVPFYGDHDVIDGIERISGIVRQTKDAIRLHNSIISKMVETHVMSSVSKPIFAPEWIKGYEYLWEEDNIRNNAYLLLNPVDTPNGPAIPQVQYSQSYQNPLPTKELLEVSSFMIETMVGRNDPQEQIQNNTNQSGVAIRQMQLIADSQTNSYLENFRASMERSGTIWLGMLKEIAVEDQRKMRGLTEDGKEEFHVLNEPNISDTGEIVTNLDLENADFLVSVTTGPSSSSRRQEEVNNLLNMLSKTGEPNIQSILTLQIMYRSEDAGMLELRPWVRQQLIERGVFEPTEEEAAKQTQKRPDPLAEAQTASLQAQTRLQDASAILKFAQTNTEEAKAAQILSTVDGDQISKVIQLTQLLATMTVNDQQAALQALQQQVQQPTQQQSMQQQPAASPISTPTGKIPSNPLEGVGISPKPTI